MYEDIAIERAAFEGRRRVFCIASAGTTALELAARHEVVACDINPAQIAYAERRAAGDPPEIGDVERAIGVARALMPVVGWRMRAVRAFLALSDVDEQRSFWRKHLDTRRFRAVFDTLLSPSILRRLYAPQFLSFLPPRFGGVLRERVERGISRHPNASNPYLRALFLGEAGEPPRPTTAKPRFVHADAASWLESCGPGSFDAFTLSNILDGAAPSYRARLARSVQRAATGDAVVVWRSFGEPDATLPTNRAECDRSLLWGVVDVRPVRALREDF
jgi:S-adenosylmethionine:diacylglycerol 3-amino-3-carboxypropyl transferase